MFPQLRFSGHTPYSSIRYIFIRVDVKIGFLHQNFH